MTRFFSSSSSIQQQMGQVQFGSSIHKRIYLFSFFFFFFEESKRNISNFWVELGGGEINIAPGRYKGDCYYYAEAKGEEK